MEGDLLEVLLQRTMRGLLLLNHFSHTVLLTPDLLFFCGHLGEAERVCAAILKTLATSEMEQGLDY
jgi:hypothetical protein